MCVRNISTMALCVCTGVLTHQVALDYEGVREYILTVRAVDGGEPPLSNTAILGVNITDSNDNAPVFPQPEYRVTVTESLAVGASLVKVSKPNHCTQIAHANHNTVSMATVEPSTFHLVKTMHDGRSYMRCIIVHIRYSDKYYYLFIYLLLKEFIERTFQ